MKQEIGKGLCLGIGGTNARVALCHNGKITGFASHTTPTEAGEFFGWIADQIVEASKEGARWAVIGVPGVVSVVNDKQAVGPLVNVPGLSAKSYILEDELVQGRSELTHLLLDGFQIKAVNDGLLAAFAAAAVYSGGQKQYHSVASFIVGTGVGGSVVRRQSKTDIFRPSESLFEIGHVPIGKDHEETFEAKISGPALHRRHGTQPKDLPSDHEVWREVGELIGQMVMIIGIVSGADLVVTCGGVGSNSYQHYAPHLEAYLEKFRSSPNAVHRLAVPKVETVDPKESQTFEMRGAEGVMKYYHSLQQAPLQPV